MNPLSLPDSKTQKKARKEENDRRSREGQEKAEREKIEREAAAFKAREEQEAREAEEFRLRQAQSAARDRHNRIIKGVLHLREHGLVTERAEFSEIENATEDLLKQVVQLRTLLGLPVVSVVNAAKHEVE